MRRRTPGVRPPRPARHGPWQSGRTRRWSRCPRRSAGPRAASARAARAAPRPRRGRGAPRRPRRPGRRPHPRPAPCSDARCARRRSGARRPDEMLTPARGRSDGVGAPRRVPYARIVVAKVLVVEDDSTVSSVLSAYLRKAGFDPRVAADGPTALQEWRQWLPDVVILDVMLPGLSGLEVLQRRRADDDVAAVIILSARGEEDDRLLGLEMGADDYMVKPFSPRESVL